MPKKKENPLSKYFGKFARIESKLKEYPVIGFDSEDNSKGVVTLFAFWSDDGPTVTKHYKEAIDYIYSREKPTYFVAHNLEYDVVNFFKHDNYDYIEDMVYSGTRLLKMTLKGCEHTFIDSSAFFQGTLKALGEFIGLEKLEGDSQDEEYVARDAQIAYEFLKQFQHRLVNQEQVNLGITIGQMSMQIYRRSYMLNKFQVTYNSPACLKAYYGGRVEAFYIGLLQEPVHVQDINSCYPDVMRNKFYPDTACMQPSKIDTHEFGVGKFRVMVPADTFLPVLPYKDPHSGRLFFPTGEFTGYWTYQEVRHAIDCGATILEEWEGEGTNAGCAPFVGYIDDFYNKRLKAKAAKSKFDDLLYKLFQNNLYGKWSQNKAGGKMTREMIPQYKIEKYFEHPDFETKKIGPFYWYKIPKIEPPKTANWLWGTYITSYARIKLHSALLEMYKAGYTPVYCDTDSIMYSNLKGENLKKDILPVSKKLGDWDIETHDLGIFRQAKAYILYDKDPEDPTTYIPHKIACKGVPTHYAHEFIIDAMATFQKPVRLKEGLVRTYAQVNENKPAAFIQELGANYWNDITKEMRSIYVKRKGTQGVTLPQDVADIDRVVKESLSDAPIPFQEEIAGLNLSRPTLPAKFKHHPIPENYFDDTPERFYQVPEAYPDKPYRLLLSELRDLKKGATWFTGIPLRHVYIKKGERIESKRKIDPKSKTKYFTQILITEFRGKKAPKNFIAEINKRILDGLFDDENYVKKNIGILLISKYIEKEYPNLGYKISA